MNDELPALGDPIRGMPKSRKPQRKLKIKTTPIIKGRRRKVSKVEHHTADGSDGANEPAGIEGLEGVALIFMDDLRALDATLETVRGKIRNRKLQAKKDGLNLKVIKQIMNEMKLPTPELIDAHNAVNAHRVTFALPAFAQMQQVSAEEQEAFMAQALLDGKRHNFAGGRTQDNPHDPGVPAGQAWLEGFQDAQSLRMVRRAR